MLRLKKISAELLPQNQFIYSLPIGPYRQGQTQARRHPQAINGLVDVPQGWNSLIDLWQQLLIKFSNVKLIENLTYNQVDYQLKIIGSWLLNNNHQKIYLYCKNCPQWTITDLACWNYGMVSIPLYDTLGIQAFSHILQLTEGSLIFTKSVMFKNLYKHLIKVKTTIKQIVFYDQVSNDVVEALEKLGIQTYIFSQIISEEIIYTKPKITLNQHLTYSFTSGTTGLPKGVICTHHNAITQLLANINFVQYYPTDVHMSYLPIAHIFQRCIIWMCIFYGANIQYSQHPAGEILKDLARIKPTIIPIVPRLLNKLYPIMKQLYQKENNKKSVKYMFGGRLRSMITASAPVAANVLSFFKNVLECDVREGYGQTQTTGLSFITHSNDINYGHVGGPNPSFQMKLVDVPQMQYLTNTFPPKGEICVRGNSIFIGYYKDQINTKQNIDNQGWSHTGDVGMFLQNGALKIIDRKKNIYKLSQGQYVAPQKVQNIYLRCKYVAQCFVYGDSLKDYNVAIIHPNLELILLIAQKLGIYETDVNILCDDSSVTKFIFTEITQQARQDGLFGFQMAKRIRLWPISFNNYGIFTNTMKLQRHIAKKTFNQEINKLYLK